MCSDKRVSEKTFLTSKKRPNLIETDEGKEFVNKDLTDLLDQNNIERYCRKLPGEQCLQNALIVLSEIFLIDQSLEK